jgi:hypothetical protein
MLPGGLRLGRKFVQIFTLRKSVLRLSCWQIRYVVIDGAVQALHIRGAVRGDCATGLVDTGKPGSSSWAIRPLQQSLHIAHAPSSTPPRLDPAPGEFRRDGA